MLKLEIREVNGENKLTINAEGNTPTVIGEIGHAFTGLMMTFYETSSQDPKLSRLNNLINESDVNPWAAFEIGLKKVFEISLENAKKEICKTQQGNAETTHKTFDFADFFKRDGETYKL